MQNGYYYIALTIIIAFAFALYSTDCSYVLTRDFERQVSCIRMCNQMRCHAIKENRN